MTKITRQLTYCTLLIFLLWPTACTEIDTKISSPAGIIETDSFRGVIFTAEQIAADPHWPNNDDPWTPSEADVMTLEEQLNDYLQEANPDLGKRLAGYTRQYWGTVTPDGHRAVYANFFCDIHVKESKRDWQTDLVQVLDGGDCYFQALYDIQEGAFVWLAINGEA